jgi:hypothetical protein
MEKRLKAVVLLAGAFPDEPTLPEVDPINFISGENSVLMINGRNHFVVAFETYQPNVQARDS